MPARQSWGSAALSVRVGPPTPPARPPPIVCHRSSAALARAKPSARRWTSSASPPLAPTTSLIWVTTISTSPHSFDCDEVSARLAAIRRRIEGGGGDPGVVRVVAVTKGFGPEAVATARNVGLTDIGKNYSQELLAKAPGPEGTRW